jgi:hypothetical protein
MHVLWYYDYINSFLIPLFIIIIQGLVALDKENLENRDKIHSALVKAQAIFPPLYT